ncbi:MAG: hypothetical protein IJ421_10825 [Prevotella sp.]|nr:hypothetical protein [Prevotella sp.]
MKKEQLYEVLGDINENYINDAHKTAKKKSRTVWTKWAAMAACLCLVVVGAFSGIHSNMKQYVVSNNIAVLSATEYSDTISSSEVSQEQADRMAVANNIHNTLSAQNYEWYASCYYDLENDKILVGLTEVSDSNKDAVLTHTGDTAVQFYECDYSYQYLEELYNKLDGKRTVLSMLGVDRFNISIEKNRINVRINNAEKYEAIYMTNEMDSIGGAIVFTSDTVTADSN